MSGKWYGFQPHVFAPAYGVNRVDVGLQTVDNVFVAADQMKLGLKLKRNVKKCLVSMMNTCSTVLHGALHLTAAVQTRYEFTAFQPNPDGQGVVLVPKPPNAMRSLLIAFALSALPPCLGFFPKTTKSPESVRKCQPLSHMKR